MDGINGEPAGFVGGFGEKFGIHEIFQVGGGLAGKNPRRKPGHPRNPHPAGKPGFCWKTRTERTS
jgi:hypothetical protein